MDKKTKDNKKGAGIKKIFISAAISMVIGIVIGIGIKGGLGKNSQEQERETSPEQLTGIADMTEEHDAILYQEQVPYLVAIDFDDIIIGESERQNKLEIMTQKVSASYTMAKSGLFSWDVFSQTKAMVFHGVGTYTVDLAKIKKEDFSVDKENQKITIRIPAPEFSVTILPEETEYFNTANGILRFGEMQLTPEMWNEIEIIANEKLYEALKNDEMANAQARRFAKISVQEDYQMLVTAQMNAAIQAENSEYAMPVYYTVEVEIDDKK